MVGTRKLARLIDHATTAGAKVVLVGDPCQLPEIDAGGAFPPPGPVGCQRTWIREPPADSRRWNGRALAELRVR